MSYLGGRTIYIDSDGNEHFDYERDYEPKPKTNADRIRAMTDEELAEFLWKYAGIGVCPPKECAEEKCGAEKCWLCWLKQEVNE